MGLNSAYITVQMPDPGPTRATRLGRVRTKQIFFCNGCWV